MKLNEERDQREWVANQYVVANTIVGVLSKSQSQGRSLCQNLGKFVKRGAIVNKYIIIIT